MSSHHELRQPARALACASDGSAAQWLVAGCAARERASLVALQASAGQVLSTKTWQLPTPAGASALTCAPDARYAATLHPGPSGSARASLHVWGLASAEAEKLACDADHASQQQSVAWSASDPAAFLTSSASALTIWRIHQERVVVRCLPALRCCKKRCTACARLRSIKNGPRAVFTSRRGPFTCAAANAKRPPPTAPCAPRSSCAM